MSVDAVSPKGWVGQLRRLLSPKTYNPVSLGDAKRDIRDWPAAAQYYKRALDLNPGNQPIWIQYGHALKESGQLAAAEAAYRRASRLDPKDADAQLQLGHCLKVQGDLKAAADCYLTGLRLDPNNLSLLGELRHLGWRNSALSEITGTAHTISDSTKFISNRALANIECPSDYSTIFPDVQALIDMGLVASAEQHFDLYGFKQGRDILATFATTKPTSAFVLCPSFFKRCGIGEHTRYLANAIEQSGLKTHRIRSTRDLTMFEDSQLRDAVLIVNHGPGLFDGYNPELSEGEATADLLTVLRRYFRSHNLRPIIFLHSLLDRDNTVMFPRQQMAIEYPIPAMTTIEAAARTFNIPRVEHGMQPIDRPKPPTKAPNCRDRPTLGFFGFFQWGGKNFDALFLAAERAKAKLVGSVATGNDEQVENLRTVLAEKAINCDLGTGWVEDSELANRLNEADYYYLPQQDYDHWNNSGTARFVMNFDRPVIVPPHNPFLDLRKFAIFSDDNDLPQIMAHLRDEKDYQAACDRIARYGQSHSMNDEMPALAVTPHALATASGVANFLDSNAVCASSLLSLPAPQFSARLLHGGVDVPSVTGSLPFSPERAQEVCDAQAKHPAVFGNDNPVVLPLQYWRSHYDVIDLIFEDRLDQLYAGIRAVLKREPDLHDLVRYGPSAAERTKPIDPRAVVENALQLFRHLTDTGHTLEFAQQVRLYHEEQPLERSDLMDQAVIDTVTSKWNQRRRAVEPNSASIRDFEFEHGYANIVDVVSCAPSEYRGYLHRISEAQGAMVDFSSAEYAVGPMARYLIISDCVAAAGSKVTDLFVIDAPIVNPVDPARKRYSVGEFYLLNGDVFIFHAIRCLLKRDPLAVEIPFFTAVLKTSGRVAVLRHFQAHPACQARITDISQYDDDELISAATEALTIGREFRSVFAGGWNQRNAYLEAKRNIDRLWLRLKTQQDLMFSQSGQSDKKIIGLISDLKS